MARFLIWVIIISPLLAAGQFWIVSAITGGGSSPSDADAGANGAVAADAAAEAVTEEARSATQQLMDAISSLPGDLGNAFSQGAPLEILAAFPTLAALALVYALTGIVAIIVMAIVPRLLGAIVALVLAGALTWYLGDVTGSGAFTGPLIYVAPFVAVLFNAVIRGAQNEGRMV